MSLLHPFADMVRALSDEQLIAAYRQAGSDGGAEADALKAEIERRGLSA